MSKNIERTTVLFCVFSIFLSSCTPTITKYREVESIEDQARAAEARGAEVINELPTFPGATLTFTSTTAHTNTSTPTITYTSTQTIISTTTKAKITSTPVYFWENIPIMMGAYNIEIRGQSISFEINESISKVFSYYDITMSNLGYKVFAYSEGGKGKLTIYQKGTITITISIAPNPLSTNVTKVILVKT